ncbi:MAG: polysaccharide lyase [Anaerolineae bacterium]|nr:polysaccharide lyase [Anaerolineae bacterium]
MLSTTACRSAGWSYSDSFESERINRYWTTTWWSRDGGVDDAVAIDGENALRVVVQQGDHPLFGKSGQATERSELNERHRHAVGQDVWYSFSVYVPEDFPIQDTRLVMGQWKQTAIFLWKKHSPAVAQRFRDGRFQITINNDSGRQYLFEEGTAEDPALVGEWTSFVYHIRFDKGENGRLEVWMNGEQVIDYTGQIGYRGDLNTSYFRLGLYRDTMNTPMTVYYDEVKIWYNDSN